MSAIRPSAADVTSMLGGIDFPASKEDLITYVHRVRDRAQAVLEILHQLPERQYNSIAEIEKVVSEII
jgi:HEAT repeat protein